MVFSSVPRMAVVGVVLKTNAVILEYASFHADYAAILCQSADVPARKGAVVNQGRAVAENPVPPLPAKSRSNSVSLAGLSVQTDRDPVKTVRPLPSLHP